MKNQEKKQKALELMLNGKLEEYILYLKNLSPKIG